MSNMPEDNLTKRDVQTLISDALIHTFSRKMIGDTPTDKFQLTPKKYVDNQITSVYTRASVTFTGNMVVQGWASINSWVSIAGALTVGGNASINGTATAGALTVNTSASINGAASIAVSLEVAGIHVPSFYPGAVGSVGAADLPFPSGWTSSLISPGSTRITHNLNSTNYTVHATGVTRMANIPQRNTNNFLIKSTSDGSTATTDDGIYFTLIKP